jgi:hypothetical protein
LAEGIGLENRQGLNGSRGFESLFLRHLGSVAQSVEQRTENPCVGGSIPSRATPVTAVQRNSCFFVSERKQRVI